MIPIWVVNVNECRVQTQYHLLEITFLRTDRTFIIDQLITISLNQWVFEPEQVFLQTLSRDNFVLPPPAELFGFPLYPTISVYEFPRQPPQEPTPAPPSPIYIADSPIYVPSSPVISPHLYPRLHHNPRSPKNPIEVAHHFFFFFAHNTSSKIPPTNLPWRISVVDDKHLFHINRYFAQVSWALNTKTNRYGWTYCAKNNQDFFPPEEALFSTDPYKPLPKPATPTPVKEKKDEEEEEEEEADNQPGTSTYPNMSTTVTEIKTEVKEGKKPVGIPPRSKTPHPDSPDDSDPGPDPPPNNPDGDAISHSFRSTTTNGFSELKERGIKPERFKGNRDKTDCFCYDFGRYLQFNIAFYPKQSERVDLFLSSINHPWADARSLELENDCWNDSIPQNKKRWTTFADIRHQFQQDFGVRGGKGRSQVVLEEISMSGNLAKLEEYIAAFELATPFTGYNDEALLWFFKAGMNPGLCRAVEGMEPEPEGLQKFITAAIHKQNHFEQQQGESKLWRKPAATPVVNIQAAPLAPAPQQTTPS
ncbi:hypothetical protein AAF712_014198 [Marasmius tenuissimus]|uniref:Retrotransposon gag domain-containing protein n=1 Tax=Marasmius tenuissimus TaxID=585030 RepID=A0ABR2ZF81_9AGAR